MRGPYPERVHKLMNGERRGGTPELSSLPRKDLNRAAGARSRQGKADQRCLVVSGGGTAGTYEWQGAGRNWSSSARGSLGFGAGPRRSQSVL